MIDTIVIDIGNVLVRFDFGRALTRLEPDCGVALEEVRGELIAVKDEYEGGKLGRQEFLEHAIRLIDYRGGTERFTQIWQEIFDENEPMTAIVPELVAGRKAYLLSNTSDLHMEYVRGMYPVFEFLPEGVYSYEAKTSKPGVAIYTQLIERFGLRAEDAVFVDDLEPNIRTAEELGFATVHYDWTRHEDGEARLRELLMCKGN